MGPLHDLASESFTPSFSRYSRNADEAQIPWGVVRLEFRNESTVFGGDRSARAARE